MITRPVIHHIMHLLSLNVNGIKHLCVKQTSVKHKPQPSITRFFPSTSTSHVKEEKESESPLSSTTSLHTLLAESNADIVFLQELKTNKTDAHKCLDQFSDLYAHRFVHASVKKGYSGVATLCKGKPSAVWVDLTLLQNSSNSLDEFCVKQYTEQGLADEGRILCVQMSDVIYINVYAVNSGKGGIRISERTCFEFCLLRLVTYIQDIMQCHVVLGGDMNVCPTLTKLDCTAPSWFSNIPGGFDNERQWLSQLCTATRLTDTYRHQHPKETKYTNTCGRHKWRLDLFLVSSHLLTKVSHADIMEDISLSDHKPITLTCTL